MKNTRTGQKTIRKLLKGAGSAILLATLFVLVFAGTLSGAFGIEENLQQNGIIESNVARAATTVNTWGDASNNNSDTSKLQTSYTIPSYSQNTTDHYYGQYFTDSASLITNGIKNGGVWTQWNVVFSGANYYALKNGAISRIEFKIKRDNTDDSNNRLEIYRDDTLIVQGSDYDGKNDEVIANVGTALGVDTGTSYVYTVRWVAYRSGRWTNKSINTKISGAWVDVYRSDNTAPRCTSFDLYNYNFNFADYADNGTQTGAAGISKIEESVNGGSYVDVTSNADITNNTKNATYTTNVDGLHKFRLTDNVANVSEVEYYIFKGAGTSEDDPYLLRNRTEFDWLSVYAKNGYDFSGRYFKVQPDNSNSQNTAKYGLAANTYINMLGTAFTPIADYGTSTSLIFRGTINGNGCTLVDFVVNTTASRSGLIGTLTGSGKIYDLNIGCANTSENSSVTSTKSDSAAFVGFLNSSSAVVENCSSYATISGTYQNGGIVANIGSSGGSISNCHNYGAVNGTYAIGGIVGIVQSSSGVVENCINDGAVTGSGDNVGGIVGNMQAGTLKGTITNNGNVTSNRSASYSDVGYSIISSRSGDYSGTQGLAKINDGDTGSKYYSSPTKISFVVDTSSAVRISGFAITNGDDNNSTNAKQQDRTVKGVYIWGSNSNDSGTSNSTGVDGTKPTTASWNLIYSSDNLSGMGTANSTRYNFSFNNFTQYRYYWVYLESRGEGVQLSEFDLRSNDLQSSTGGIAGNFNGSITDGATLTTAGTVTSSGYNVGGIFGYLNSSVNANFNVTTNASDAVSGIAVVGGAFGFVNSTATVKGTIIVNAAEIDKETGGNYCFGGAIGYNAGTIEASITVTSRVLVRSSGIINGYTGAFAGGIVGYNAGTISGNTEKTGGDVLDVSKSGMVGGLAGFNSGTLSGNFTTIVTSPLDSNFKVIDGGQYVGGAVGYNIGNVSGTSVINTLIKGTAYVGGFIGYNGKDGLEISGYTNVSEVSGKDNVGGIVGGSTVSITIKNSTNSGAISGANYVGGLMGRCDTTSFTATASSNTGTVVGSNKSIGGILGGTVGASRLDISNCFNKGNITNTGNLSNIGGIVGRAYTALTDANSILIVNCYNLGTIDDTAGSVQSSQVYGAGGIVGYLRANAANAAVIRYCYNKAKVAGKIFVGGIAGGGYTNQHLTIEYCYTTVDATNSITATDDTVGAIIGGSNGGQNVTSNFNVINSWGFYSDATVLSGHNTGKDRFGAYVLVEGFGKQVYPIIDNAIDTDWTKIVGKDITSFYIESGISVRNGYYLALLKENNGEGAGVAKSFATPSNIGTLSITANTDGSTAFGIITYLADVAVSANQRNIHIYEEIIEYTAPDTEYTGPNSEFNKQGKAGRYIWNLQNSQTALRSGYLATFVLDNGDDVNVTETGYTFDAKITADGVSPEKIFGQLLNEQGAKIVARKLTIDFDLLYNTLLIGDGNNIYRNDAFGLERLKIGRVLDYGSFGNVITLNANNAMSGFSYSYQEEQVFTAVGTFSATNIGEYNYTITINSANYEFEYPAGEGTFVNSKSWSYNIVAYDLADHFNEGKVWFGANTQMVVTNNALTAIKAPDGTVVASYYPLNRAQGATPQALVYEKVNYSKENFIIYVQYSNGNVEAITLGTNYTLSDLETAGDDHVNTGASVTASGLGNFTSTVTKYYVVLDSDFGWTSADSSAKWGTKDNPYVISTQAQLMRLSQILNGGVAWNSINSDNTNIVLAKEERAVATDKTYEGAYFVVTADIHLDETFKPIGNAENIFKATSFASNTDGELVTISYYYNGSDTVDSEYEYRDYVGLFGNVEGTHFKDLLVWGGSYNGGTSYTGKQIIGQNYVGGLVGKIKDGIVENCTFTSNVGGASIIGNNCVGGLIGYAENTQVLYDTSYDNMGSGDNLVSAKVTGVNYVGGIIGQWIIKSASQFNNGNANGLYFATTANVIVTSTGSYAGAIAGALDASECADNFEIQARLNVIAKVATRTVVNGVNYVGALYGSFIGNGTDTASVTYNGTDVWATIQFGESGKVVGGFIGYLQDATFKFTKSYDVDNKSIVFEASSGKTPSFFGGVIGVLGKGANIANGMALDDNNKTFLTIKNTVNFGKDYTYGDFVGGVVGYVSSGAGRSNIGSTIFGDDLVFIGQGEIHANNYVGGIFGAIGIVDNYQLKGDLYDGGCLENNLKYGSTTNVANANIVTFKPSSAKNLGGIFGTDNVGGLVGGVFKKALIYLENPVTDADNPTFVVSNEAKVEGSTYVGGIVGYLEQESHVLNRIVNTGVIGATNASYVGGLVGYMIGGAISNSVSASKTSLDENTNLYLGSKYVGGLVGFMQSGSLENSLSTGFKFDDNNTSLTKGGVVGDKLSPIIEGSWTIYIATDPTYSTVSPNKNGKYVLIDSSIKSEVGTFAYVLAMAGICTQTTYNNYTFQQGELLIGVFYPTKTNFGDESDTTAQPEQLAFYDVSGSDSVMSTPTTVFTSANGIVRMGVSMADGDSYSVCKYDVMFSDISKFLTMSEDITSAEIEDARNNIAELANATNDQIIAYILNEKGRKNAQQGYRAPSGASNNYRAEVTTALYDNGGNITRIIANIYFKDIIIGSVEGIVGNYDSGTLEPGKSEASALTISTQAEWNDFAWNIYTGQEDYSGMYVKLLTNITIDKKTTHTGTNKASYNFNAEITNHSYNTGNATDSVNAKSNLGYNMAGNIAMGAGAMATVTFSSGSGATAGSKTPSFKGTFDGNGYTITIKYEESASRASVFPNAQNATFKNLTVDGYVKATSLSGGYNDTVRSMKDYNLLSSKSGNSATADEGIFKISDDNTGTKYYSVNNSMSFVAEFVAPLAISGFAITNGNDNETQTARTIRVVKIWGSNKDRGTTMNHEQTAGEPANTSDGWELVYNNEGLNIGNGNQATYNTIVSNTVAYKYYWVYLEGGGGGVQLSEFGFLQGMGYDCAGFVGKPFGNLTFTNCKNEADINAYRNAAGILGFNDSGYTITLESCVNEGNITSLEGSFTLEGRTSTYSYDEGWGYAAYSYGTGGIIGSVKGNLEIQSCRNTGRIIGGHNVGGIIGCSDGTSDNTATLIIDSCANSGYILANSGYWSADEGNRDSGGTSDYEGANSYGIRLNIFGYAGGLVGRTGSNSILKMYASYNSGEVTCLANMVGGLVGGVGYLYQKEATVNYVITGGKSVIAYCYNTGNVNAGGTFPKHTKNLGVGGLVDQERENDGGTVVGGIAGIVGNIRITDCYNLGDVTAYGITAYKRSWQLRAGGIVGHSEPKSGNAVEFNRCYNIGTIKSRHILNTMGTTWDTTKDLRYGAGISGYCDNVDNSASRVSATNCYSIAYSVSIRVANQDKKIYEYRNKDFNSWKSDERRVNWLFASGVAGIGDADVNCVKVGDLCTNYRALTALMKSDASVNVPGTGWKTGNAYNNFNGTDTTFNLTASYDSIDANLATMSYSEYPSGWIFVYGCLPQLAVFAVDTYNGLSMRSVNYGRDVYGTYQREIAGEEYSPFVIKDGIDLLGLQTLVDMGYSFEGKYVEFADGTNNLDETASKIINMPVDDTSYTSTNAYQYSEDGTNYYGGKSYHLFSRGSASDYTNWQNANYRYTAGSTLTVGTTFANQNFIAIGRNGKDNIFKGHISGAQTDGSVTEVTNLRIVNKEVAGLFGYVQDAEVRSIAVSGMATAYANGTDSNSRSVAGGIVAVAYGASIIDGCEAGSQNRPIYVYAYGKTATYNESNTVNITTSAGGIVGLANTARYRNGSLSYSEGTTATISNNKVVNTYVRSAKNNIGGIVGLATGTASSASASNMNNKVEISSNIVERAEINAESASGCTLDTVGTRTGGIIGYSDQNVAIIVRECVVGTDSATNTVTIQGENRVGGIVGETPDAVSEIIGCKVLKSATIERASNWGVVTNAGESGTAIGGIVGLTYNASGTDPITTTFSGNIVFQGTISVGVQTNYISASNNSNDGVVRNVGGIVGDMGSGARIATGSTIEVGGTIEISAIVDDTHFNRNIGGVAGRTKDVAFSGTFKVAPTITATTAYQIGGFIGKNNGIVNILADDTDIEIGGNITASHDVGGFIGFNSASSTLLIGADQYRAVNYNDGLSIKIVMSVSDTDKKATIDTLIKGEGDNVGGIVGNSEQNGVVKIVKGTIVNVGQVAGQDNVGGIIGINNGTLSTGGSVYDTTLEIINEGKVSGNDFVGGVIGKLNVGQIAGRFINRGNVSGRDYVGGSIGYVAKEASILSTGAGKTEFINEAVAIAGQSDALVAADDAIADDSKFNVSGRYYVGGSIGLLLGRSLGNEEYKVEFRSKGTVDGDKYVGGSIGVLAGKTEYTDFISEGEMTGVGATTAVGGSVGFIGVPNPLIEDDIVTEADIVVSHTHFEANGTLTLNGTDGIPAGVNEYVWGGIGGAIGAIGNAEDNLFDNKYNDRWTNNTYYASGNVTAEGFFHVGGIVGLIKADNITIENMLAYDTKVTGGKNVGGIVGATIGANTVINSAYSISTNENGGIFTAPQGNAGGIIGLAQEDTDASTSYWVKGYTNAELAGSSVTNLKTTLGRYTLAYEVYTLDGKEVTVVFTKELIGTGTTTGDEGGETGDEEVAIYPTPYAYYESVGTHKATNGTTYTINEEEITDDNKYVLINEELTWQAYFDATFGTGKIKYQKDVGAWVEEKSSWTEYSTGTEQTGWYFVYANDQQGGNNQIGTVDAVHSTATTEGYSDLWYWKRIANAYTMNERNAGYDDDTKANSPYKKTSLDSAIVRENVDGTISTVPHKGNLYATATAANFKTNANASGYYMYIASSGDTKPTSINYEGKFFIQAEGGVSQNVAVYYRSIAMGSALTYNGYERYAPITLQNDITYNSGSTSDPLITDGTIDVNRKNKYFYNTQNVEAATKEYGTYHSTVNVYYFDDEGKAYVVGGIDNGVWRINKRKLSFTQTGMDTHYTYGEKYETGDGEDGGIRTTLTVENIVAPDQSSFNFEISITAGDSKNTELATIRWTSSNGNPIVTITENTAQISVSTPYWTEVKNSKSESDKKYTVGNASNGKAYGATFVVTYKMAKTYNVKISKISDTKNYQFDTKTHTLTVERRSLSLSLSPTGAQFDNAEHVATWTISGTNGKEGIISTDSVYTVLSQFAPKVYAVLGDADKGDTIVPYSLDWTSVSDDKNGAIEIKDASNNVIAKFAVEGNTIKVSMAKNVGTYYIEFGAPSDNCNYKFGSNDTTSYTSPVFKISNNTLQVKWTKDKSAGRHTYDSQTYGKMIATITATHAINDYQNFILAYFNQYVDGKKLADNEKIKATVSGQTATIVFETSNYEYGTYRAGLGYSGSVQEVNCRVEYENGTTKDGVNTIYYYIDRATITLSFEGMTGANVIGTYPNYTYNTKQQGLSAIVVNGLYSADASNVYLNVSGVTASPSSGKLSNGKLPITLANNNFIDANTYSASVSLKTASGATKNYVLSGSTSTSWTISPKELSISGLTGGNVDYDATAHYPTIDMTGSGISSTDKTGVFQYGNDTIVVNYSITGSDAGVFVNAGQYKIKVADSNTITATRNNQPVPSTNYKVVNKPDNEVTFTINSAKVEIIWVEFKEGMFVYNRSAQGLTIASLKFTANGSSITKNISNGKFAGYGTDKLAVSISGNQTNAGSGYVMEYKSHSLEANTTNSGIAPIKENYSFTGGLESDAFSIDKSILNIARTGGSITKVYDATGTVPQDQLDGLSFGITSTNKGDRSLGASAFNITATYLGENVGTNIGIRISYSLKSSYNTNYSYESASEDVLIGTITPATITVTLDRLRNGRATRTFAEDKNGNISVYYGGANGAVNGQRSNRSQTYRLGEGFTISGFPSAETAGVVRVLAKYVEVGSERALFDGYVNYVYDDGNGYVKGVATSDYVVRYNLYKALEFSIEDATENNGKAANYNFKVVDTAGDSITGDAEAQLGTVGKVIRVYDSNDQDNKNVGKQAITIEITVKTYKIKYGNTSQSYANSDGSYNKDWLPVEAVDLPSGIKVDVVNGWMTDENGQPKTYKQYTVIRGRANSTELSASVSGSNGKQLNYNMTNQPVLTIGYFVEDDGNVFEIGSLSSLLIASYYWWVSANSGNPEFNQVINTTVTWNALISDTDYSSDNPPTFAVPSGAPVPPDTVTTWDEYFLWLETEKGITVFLNENENNTWGYYTTTTGAGDVKKYSSFKQIRDINGTFTQSDIEMLNGFFRVYDVTSDSYITKEWGKGGEFITNFLKVGEGNVAVAIGSIFKSLENGFTGAYDGGGYVIEYFNIMSFEGAENVGMFDVLGGNATVKNLHLRNFNINANKGNVGGIAGKALAGENAVENVSWHGTISMSGDGNVGGLIGVSARSIDKAIALGTINAKGGNIGGLIGSIEQGASVAISNAVSFVYIDATGNVGAITASTNGATAPNAFYLASSAWKRTSDALTVSNGTYGTAKTYTQLIVGESVEGVVNAGSISGYTAVNGKKYYQGSAKGTYDMLDDFNLSENANRTSMNARQSMRLKDIIDVYMLMYSIVEVDVKVNATDEASSKVYTISSTSWLVGDKHGVDGDEIEIGNRQQVALLRELRFASFVLTSDVVATATSGGDYAYGGAFFGNVKVVDGSSYTIDFGSGKRAFEALATGSNVPYKEKV